MPAKVKRSAARSRRTRATPAHDAPHTAAGNRPAESLHAGAKAVAAARERHEIGHAAAGRESLPHGPDPRFHPTARPDDALRGVVPVTDEQRPLRPASPTEFTHTHPWPVLRITAELLEGVG